MSHLKKKKKKHESINTELKWAFTNDCLFALLNILKLNWQKKNSNSLPLCSKALYNRFVGCGYRKFSKVCNMSYICSMGFKSGEQWVPGCQLNMFLILVSCRLYSMPKGCWIKPSDLWNRICVCHNYHDTQKKLTPHHYRAYTSLHDTFLANWFQSCMQSPPHMNLVT